jgi:peptidylprolyl isomerase
MLHFIRWKSLCWLIPLSIPFLRHALSFSTQRITTTRVVPISRRADSLGVVSDGDDEYQDIAEAQKNEDSHFEETRRGILSATVSIFAGGIYQQQPAWAAPFFPSRNSQRGAFVVESRDEMSDTLRKEQVDTPEATLSSEYALLKVLPVNNPVFRTLEQKIESISTLRKVGFDLVELQNRNSTWTDAHRSIETAILVLSNKRAQLEPVFNPEDSTEVAILKAERGEILIEQLREELVQLSNATTFQNSTCAFKKQKEALITLGFIGELIVKEFPYRIPSRGKFSFLPRLLGRATVTLRIKRRGTILGNITIVADGYTAPITAGNFVDLCLRNFYTGLPIKAMAKRFPTPTDIVPATINVLGSFNEGFYDPLTAKLRRIPLEIIRLEKGSGQPKLSYSTRGSPDVLLVCKTCLSDMGDEATFESAIVNSKPLLTFDTPGLVALNHPNNNPNGGSSEFFALSRGDLPNKAQNILDSEYAPFGYIIRGFDLYQTLQPEDIIDATFVDEFGQLNLAKIRQSSFKDAAQGSEQVEQ